MHQPNAKWQPAGVAAVCCGLLAGCAALAPALVPPPRSYGPPTLLVHSHNYPNYPDVYQDTGRIGEVFASCAILPDRRVTNCRVLGVEGGEAFGESVLAWLTYPNFRLPPMPADRPDPHPGYHTIVATFCPPTSGNILAPISGAAPHLPTTYDGPRAHASVVADCVVGSDGRPEDCRIVSTGFSDPLDAPALAWLSGSDVRYPTIPLTASGPHRLIAVLFAPPPDPH